MFYSSDFDSSLSHFNLHSWMRSIYMILGSDTDTCFTWASFILQRPTCEGARLTRLFMLCASGALHSHALGFSTLSYQFLTAPLTLTFPHQFMNSLPLDSFTQSIIVGHVSTRTPCVSSVCVCVCVCMCVAEMLQLICMRCLHCLTAINYDDNMISSHI